MTQKELTTEQAQQKLREMKREMREVRAQLDEYATRLEAAGLNGEIDPRDLAAADELSDRLDTLHTEMIALQMTPAFMGEPQAMTPDQLAHERIMSRAAKASNQQTREAIGSPVNLLPRLRGGQHKATRHGVHAAIIQIGRADRLA